MLLSLKIYKFLILLKLFINYSKHSKLRSLFDKSKDNKDLFDVSNSLKKSF